MDGGPLTVKHAALRMAPDFLFQLWRLAGTFVVIGSLDLEVWQSLAPPLQSALFAQHLTALWWMSALSASVAICGLAEVCTYYVSNEGRALHDLLAGTVVVFKGPEVITAADLIHQPRRGLLR